MGRFEEPTFDLLTRLAFCQATLCEIQRMATVAEGVLPHRAKKDTKIGSYEIPKGTEVVLNIRHLMTAEKYFEKPDSFDPERFLSEEGLLRRDIAAFMPFGVGKRICLGEHLARKAMEVFLVKMLQKFEFLPPEDKGDILYPDDKKFITGTTRICDDYNIRILEAN